MVARFFEASASDCESDAEPAAAGAMSWVLAFSPLPDGKGQRRDGGQEQPSRQYLLM